MLVASSPSIVSSASHQAHSMVIMVGTMDARRVS
jgi:hypothetical protein